MNREILRLAIPNILSNISVPLLSSFDTALMGGLGSGHIAAVGLGSMAFNFIYWNFGFLRMGSTGMTAQAFGRQQQGETALVLGRAVLLAFFIALLLLLLQWPLLWLTHGLLNVQADQSGMMADYFLTRIWAAPASLGLMALMGWFFGMQNAIYPLLLTLLVNAANMGLSYYLVVIKGFDIKGVAYGTVIAQYLGLLVGWGFIWWRYTWVFSAIRLAALLQAAELKAFLRINSDIFIRTLCLTLSFTFFLNRANSLPGEAIVAANVILLQLVNWMSYGIDGFAFAAESLVGKYYGAKDTIALRQAIRLSFAWGMALAGVYALLYLGIPAPILSLFTQEAIAPELIHTALAYMPLLAAFCLLATPCYIFDGVFVGLTAAKAMRQTMLLAFAAYLATYWLLSDWGNTGLWLSLIAFMVYRAILQGVWYQKGWVK